MPVLYSGDAGSIPAMGLEERFMNTEMYNQCALSQGSTNTVGWIPARAARKGVRVELKGCDGLWTVESVGTSLSADVVQERQNDFRNTRKASDV
jgi:hypothetical protein